MEYPFIETHTVWGHTFPFRMTSYKSESWYGIKGIMDRMGCSRREAEAILDGWNPDLRDLIRPGDVVFDVGANEGHTTVVFAHQVGPDGAVFAFDGCGENCEKILDNVALNGLKNVAIKHAIVGATFGEERHFAHEMVQGDGGEVVQTFRLDDWHYYRPTVIKIDVEGYELRVLQGATKILAECRPKLEVEMHLSTGTGVNMTRAFGFDPHDILRLLRGFGYRLTQNGQEVVEPVEGMMYAVPEGGA